MLKCLIYHRYILILGISSNVVLVMSFDDSLHGSGLAELSVGMLYICVAILEPTINSANDLLGIKEASTPKQHQFVSARHA